MKDDTKYLRARKRFEYFAIPLGILLLLTVTWPVRNIALVYWVRGSAAYSDGIRVLRGKPIRFSDGQLVPDLPDFVTGLLAFLVAMFAAIFIVEIISRVYDKFHSKNAA